MGDLKEHRIIMGSTRTGMSQGLRFLATVEGGIDPARASKRLRSSLTHNSVYRSN